MFGLPNRWVGLCTVRGEVVNDFRFEVRIPAQVPPVLMPGDKRHAFYRETRFKQATRSMVAKIVEVEVFDTSALAGGSERVAHVLVLEIEDAITTARLSLEDSPRVDAG